MPFIGTTCSTEDCKELMMAMHYVPKEICVAINEKLGITNDYDGDWPPPERTTSDPGSMWTDKFDGTYKDTASGIDNAGSANMAGCITQICSAIGTTPNYTLFYQVLLAR